MVTSKVTSTAELNVEDPVEQMLKKTGCTELHYQIQECIAETRDWRKCQEQVKKFKDCMTKYKRRQDNLNTWQAECCKMVIVVRTDIFMSKGKIAAQCAHAALECYRKTTVNPKKQHMFEDWLRIGQPKIILKITSEQELLALQHEAQRVGLTTAIIRDAGRTQLKPGTVSVLGIGPGLNKTIDGITSHLKLL